MGSVISDRKRPNGGGGIGVAEPGLTNRLRSLGNPLRNYVDNALTDMPEDKNWWAPVWRGLVCDSQAVHYHKIKSALWLYLFLLLHANRRTGLLFYKIKTIGSETGWKRDAIHRWFRLLRTNGYVATRNTGRSLEIRVTKWKPLRGAAVLPPQKYENHHSRGRRNHTGPSGMNHVSNHILSREINRRQKRTK